MNINYTQTGKEEKMEIDINGYGDKITLLKDKDYNNGKDVEISIDFKSKSNYSGDKDIKLKPIKLQYLLNCLKEISDVDITNMLKKHVYVLPFESKRLDNLINNLEKLQEVIKPS
jgi:hypothetical protein